MTFGILASAYVSPSTGSFSTGTYTGQGVGDDPYSFSVSGDPSVAFIDSQSNGSAGFAIEGSYTGFLTRAAVSVNAAEQVALRSGPQIEVTGTGGAGMNESGEPGNYLLWEPASPVIGTYTGNGSASQGISLASNCELVLVGNDDTFYKPTGWALKDRVGYYRRDGRNQSVQFTGLSSSGGTLTVTDDLNDIGDTYYYVGITESPKVNTTYTGDGTASQDISLGSACQVVFVTDDASIQAEAWRTGGGMRYHEDNTQLAVVQLDLSADGLTATVQGTASGLGLNVSGTTYYVVGW